VQVPEARRLSQETFVRWGMELEQVDLASLLVSEVVTNVVLHAASAAPRRTEFAHTTAGGPAGDHSLLEDWPGPLRGALDLLDSRAGDDPDFSGKEFTLRLRRGTSAVWVEVFDADLRLPRIRTAGETDEGGRGLYLVDQLASRWGSRPTTDGKAVWFEIPLRAATA
jgi:anti-sigma regulatory factor (Ser/Thr protein kinase)